MRVQKSTGVSFILAFLFGPLGLLYVSKLWGSLLSLGCFYFLIASDAPFTSMGSFVDVFIFFAWWSVAWIVCLILSVVLATRNNKKVALAQQLTDEARHQETLAALEGRQNV